MFCQLKGNGLPVFNLSLCQYLLVIYRHFSHGKSIHERGKMTSLVSLEAWDNSAAFANDLNRWVEYVVVLRFCWGSFDENFPLMSHFDLRFYNSKQSTQRKIPSEFYMTWGLEIARWEGIQSCETLLRPHFHDWKC